MINTDYRNDSTRHKGEAETATAVVGDGTLSMES